MTIARPHTATSWDLVLDALDARLVSAAEASDVSNTLDEWTPPSDLGPLPVRLVGRARSILGRTDRLVEDLDATRVEVGRELSTLARRSSMQVAAPASASVDVSA